MAEDSAEVRAVLEAAEARAVKARAPEVQPEHVLRALAASRPASVAALLDRHKVTEAALEAAFPKEAPLAAGEPDALLPTNGAAVAIPLPPSAELAAALLRARGRAAAAQRLPLACGDLLLALADDRGSRAGQALANRFALPPETIERILGKSNGKPAAGEATPAPPPALALPGGVATPVLDARALEARIDAIAYRAKKLERRLGVLYVLVSMLTLSIGMLSWYIFFRDVAPIPE